MEDNNLLAQVKVRAQEWLDGNYNEHTKEEIRKMMREDPEGLIDAFYKNLEFGTGGLRGIMGAGTNRMNIYTVGMATQGLANYLKKQFAARDRISVVISHDCRNNSRLFAETVAGIFAGNGFEVYLFEDLRPTPELSFAIRYLHCQSGVMITASHNPKDYNGYKAYWEDGAQVIPPHDKAIIGEVARIKDPSQVKFDGPEEKIKIIGKEVDEAYLQAVTALSLTPEAVKRHHDLKIVYTPIHGTGVKMVPTALERYGFTNIIHVPEQDVVDGNFPTVVSPNPEEHAALEMALKRADETGAELVMASDPDGDRLGIAVRDDKGEMRLLNGNQTATLLTYYLLTRWKEKKKLTGKEYIVKTIVTTDLIGDIAKYFGVKYYDVLTGFKWIADIIRRNEKKMTFIGGGEESYGFMIGDFVRDKDAVSTAVMMAETAAWAREQGKSLLDLLKDIYMQFSFYKEDLLNIVRKGKKGAEEIQAMMDRFRHNFPETINGANVMLIHDYLKQQTIDLISDLRYHITLPKSNVLQFITHDGSKVSMRPSGTEPKIKFYFSVKRKLETPEDFNKTDKELKEKIEAIKKDLGLVK
ncbi:MAG: phospho-sugar mutase [Bacteroidales bacterium]|nr:phospho-sugar mutase [Bacteroidales bacterium]